MRDLHNQVAVRHTLVPAVVSADTTSTTVDRRGFESVEHAVIAGQSGDTLSGSLKIDIRLEHSHDASVWEAVTTPDVIGADVDAAGFFATIDDAAEDEAVYRIGYIGGRRYSRVVADFTGTHTNGTPMAALALLGHAHAKPV
ncbi:hypothetical protein NBRC116588_29520 [Pyruvatibacter sp. HU-CL02332]|uniref:hypothetical protein n=1 Tax=Pyruvatibacter sp. HU-CL02332 TaxID=3127650 RepID=UPI0031071D45